MNEDLEKRWRRGERPFDGPALVADSWIPENTFLLVVRRALELLQDAYGTNDLSVNEDWHDHDGITTPARQTSWTEVVSWTRSIEELRASCSDDWSVHTLLFPSDFTFCLRYWLDRSHEVPMEGSFDLWAEGELIEKLALSLRSDGVALTIEPSAKDYFDQKLGR